MTVTEADYARMGWHARQRLNEHLKRESDALTEQLRQLRSELRVSAKHHRPVTMSMFEAQRILATLPKDPDATAHQLAVWEAVR